MNSERLTTYDKMLLDKGIVVALAMDAPGRYIMGLSAGNAPDAGTVKIGFPVHASVVDGQLVIQPLTLFKSFEASLAHYAGIGEVHGTTAEDYRRWLAMYLDPPEFGEES